LIKKGEGGNLLIKSKDSLDEVQNDGYPNGSPVYK